MPYNKSTKSAILYILFGYLPDEINILSMSTYDENLRSMVVNALMNQELIVKQQYAQQNAAQFNLFYARTQFSSASAKPCNY